MSQANDSLNTEKVTKALSLQMFSLAMKGNMEKQITVILHCPPGEQGGINKVKGGVSCN